MAVVVRPRPAATARLRPLGHPHPVVRQAAWFVAVSTLAFLVPLVFSSFLELPHDVYYLVYFAAVGAAFTAYVRTCEVDIFEVATRNWKPSLALGLASAAFVTWSVLGRIAPTLHPSGPYFAFEILWRGVVYGTVDALLLSAFPGLIAWEVMQRDVTGAARRISYGMLTLALVVIITATYHAGYKDLQNVAGISQPEIGNTIISVPVIASANPAGSIVAHVSMHLAAVTHSYESRDRLPPQVLVRPGLPDQRRGAGQEDVMFPTLLAIPVIAALYWFPIRRWMNQWGATPTDRAREMAGDSLLPDYTYSGTTAAVVRARPEQIWPWLVQIGYQRGGLYSYDWLDRLFGYLDRPSATRILPEFQHLAVGDRIPLGRGPSWPVALLDPGRALVLDMRNIGGLDWVWQFGLFPIDEAHTRLVSRSRVRARSPWARLLTHAIEPAGFLMTRRMLIGVKQRAEALEAAEGAHPRGHSRAA